MGHAWWVTGNFLKVCLPSGELEALIMLDCRREREGEEDGVRERKMERGRLREEDNTSPGVSLLTRV